jgi:riboflavin synthase
MFTGIISITGRLLDIQPAGGGFHYTVDPGSTVRNIETGESIAVNGVCLTVDNFSADGRLVFHISAETAGRTTLKDLHAGSILNLERALELNSRLGGHFVSGHVDDIGKIVKFNSDDNPVLKIRCPESLGRFIAVKGSIAVDGISLTIADLDEDTISVALVPHTVHATNLSGLQPGHSVNLEVDMIARYIVRAMECREDPRRVTWDFLKKSGFLKDDK